MSVIRKSIIILIVLLLIPVLLYFCFPQSLLYSMRSIDRSKAGLEKKDIQIDDHRIFYLEGGKGETVLLVHGFGGDKDNWTRFARSLSSSYHVVIPDLPGFGESTKDFNAAYDIESQVSRLKKFVDTLRLEKFHIAGNSMGGSISGVFSITYPDMVLTLALLDSSGVKSPDKSDFQKMIETGRNPLLVNSAEEYDNMLKMVFHEQPPIPSPVKRYLASVSIESRPLREKIMKDRKGLSSKLADNLDKLEMPVLILWGDKDRLIDVSCVEVFSKGIKNNTVAIMKDCGHLPMMERPDECAEIYLNFLRNLP